MTTTQPSYESAIADPTPSPVMSLASAPPSSAHPVSTNTSLARVTDASAVTAKPRKRRRGNNWSKKPKQKRVTHAYKNVKVRFICPSLIGDVKTFKVRATYKHSPGLRTTLHYPQQCKQEHKPYTCKPKTIGVRAMYTWFNDMQTTLHYPQRLVLKHYLYV
jgi:hypothetical protein